MNKTSEFRLVRPVDVAVSGASFSSDAGGTYFDREGVLRTAPANTLRVTYDPADLSKAPYALVEQEATNRIRNNTMQGAVVGAPGSIPSNWSFTGAGFGALNRETVALGSINGVDFIDLRISGTTTTPGFNIGFEPQISGPAAATGQRWALSVFLAIAGGSTDNITAVALRQTERISAGQSHREWRGPALNLSSSMVRHDLIIDTVGELTAMNQPSLSYEFPVGRPIDITIRIGLPQFERDKVTSPIKTSGTAVTRAADVVGPGAGLVYSNVPIEEPAYSAVATYDASQKVHDPTTGESYLSLSGGNVGRSLADIAFWLPMGPINRRLAFDKAVNSQSTNPDLLVYAIVPGALVSDVMLLNISGARVTVEQPASGYRRTVSLVSHEVTNWYEFYAEQPQWVGDAYFENLVPHAAGPIIIIIEAPGSTAALGCAFLGKSKVIGHTLDSLEAGVISYSSTKTDAQGNMRMVRRPNARRMSCDVYVQEESKNEVYRLLTEFTDVELAVVASSKYTMTYQYGYLGQWSVPLRRNEPVRIEFKGLI